MFTITRFIALGAILPVFLALGCGGETATVDKINDAAPEEIPGGGVSSGAIDGKINVYAIDDVTDAPIAGAAVLVGEAGDAAPLEGTTDATGLVTFKDASLQGATTITVTAADHVATTWFGVNGANVTIALAPKKAPTVETANAAGSIAGWDTLPATANHIWLALVTSSWSGKLGDPSNDIQQPAGMGLPPNACLKLPPPAPATPCDWKLVARTGKQIHFAVIVDVDTNGTLMDQSDDTRTFYGYAFKTGIDLKAGDNSTGEVLEMFAPDGLVDLQVMAPAVPAGLDQSDAITLLDMGDEGQLPFFFGDQLAVSKVPALAGIFASGRYDVIAHAGVMSKPMPATTTYNRGVDITKMVTLAAYPAVPTDLAATGGEYAFKPVAGATIHGANFQVPMGGERVWNVTLYDGRSSFAMPPITPDPLPLGKLNMSIAAITVPDVDLQNFDAQAAQDKLTAVSENGIEITH